VGAQLHASQWHPRQILVPLQSILTTGQTRIHRWLQHRVRPNNHIVYEGNLSRLWCAAGVSGLDSNPALRSHYRDVLLHIAQLVMFLLVDAHAALPAVPSSDSIVKPAQFQQLQSA
jgi:hypothetical protein